jgi:hypothetical protein
METWATFSIIDHLKPIGDQAQEELDQLEAVDYLREAQVGEPSFCREFNLSDAPETRMNRGGDFSNIYKMNHFVDSGSFCLGNGGGKPQHTSINRGRQCV